VEEEQTMLRISLFTIALALIAGPAALAEGFPKQPPPVSQGDEQERAACHPDVMRYCRSLVKDDDNNDVFAILNCLQTNRPKISAACRQVLASHGQ
jgi:hypothetical protein